MMTLPRNRWLISVTALLFTVSCSGDDEAKNGKSADKTVEKHVPKLHDAEPLKPESLKPLENAPVTPLPQQGHAGSEIKTMSKIKPAEAHVPRRPREPRSEWRARVIAHMRDK